MSFVLQLVTAQEDFVLDISLSFDSVGEGEDLILLHGNGENRRYFEHQTAFFAKSRRVWAVDTRGHGDSPRGTAPFTLSQFADDLFGFTAEHGIAKADILGFSDGGNIALLFALKYPEKVNRLILNGANLNTRGVKLSVQLPVEIGFRIAAAFSAVSEKARRNAEILSLMTGQPNILPDELKRLTMPVLVTAGTNDMIKRSHTELIFNSLPNAELNLIEGDHFVAAKNPVEFNLTVDRFLKGR